jgi:hypothetical protein
LPTAIKIKVYPPAKKHIQLSAKTTNKTIHSPPALRLPQNINPIQNKKSPSQPPIHVIPKSRLCLPTPILAHQNLTPKKAIHLPNKACPLIIITYNKYDTIFMDKLKEIVEIVRE